ncbi:hypothetical protein L1049_016292 [Liquidambar formosana]|uniref:DUF7788 domain-containing protein n=1 Tax=Liquidambar formosana TaxID=63359 RepID=A0AAP0RZ23_LIQFO
MEFDEASGLCSESDSYSHSDSDSERWRKGWVTDYKVIQRKFKKKGFNRMPEIVFWNLRHSSATQAAADESGVALVSGFSKNLIECYSQLSPDSGWAPFPW